VNRYTATSLKTAEHHDGERPKWSARTTSRPGYASRQRSKQRAVSSDGWLYAVQGTSLRLRRGKSLYISDFVKRQRVWIFASLHWRKRNRCCLYEYTGRYGRTRSTYRCLVRRVLATAAAAPAKAATIPSPAENIHFSALAFLGATNITQTLCILLCWIVYTISNPSKNANM
jgi:hypothetical protein